MTVLGSKGPRLKEIKSRKGCFGILFVNGAADFLC